LSSPTRLGARLRWPPEPQAASRPPESDKTKMIANPARTQILPSKMSEVG